MKSLWESRLPFSPRVSVPSISVPICTVVLRCARSSPAVAMKKARTVRNMVNLFISYR